MSEDGLVWAIVVSPALVAAGKLLMDLVAKTLAMIRLRTDPLYDVGSRLRCVRRGTAEIFGRCVVHKIGIGRIEVRGIDDVGAPDGTAMSWGLQEFQDFDPIAEV